MDIKTYDLKSKDALECIRMFADDVTRGNVYTLVEVSTDGDVSKNLVDAYDGISESPDYAEKCKCFIETLSDDVQWSVYLVIDNYVDTVLEDAVVGVIAFGDWCD